MDLFYREKASGLASFYKENASGLTHLNNKTIRDTTNINDLQKIAKIDRLKKIKVNTITGLKLLETINKKIELCKLDVEGLSYEVLNSFGDRINDILSFHIECEHREVWKDQKLYLDVKEFMENKNYEQIYFKYVAEGTLQSDSIWVLKHNII